MYKYNVEIKKSVKTIKTIKTDNEQCTCTVIVTGSITVKHVHVYNNSLMSLTVKVLHCTLEEEGTSKNQPKDGCQHDIELK